ncbi:hypothetical protein L6164_032661 [Bauhinia variegata]|uniref:Uncharacterized protein n=1 Tax=Bauhinia variegata TaxID=167791 RepID=A0ACB9KPP4_BAUVA|nr:hypothetical protein L6164_032661 [Bauhinia variegata]
MVVSDNGKHVAIFAFPAGSHVNVILNLALKLAQAAPNVRFSFFNTAKFNQTLSSNPHIPENIKAYDVADGIPEGHVLGHPVEAVNLFLQAGPQNLQKGIDFAVQETKERVTCIIADAFVASSLIVAQNLQVPWIALWASHPCALSAHMYTDSIRHRFADGNIRTLDFIPGLSKIFIEDLPGGVLRDGEEDSIFSRTLASMGEVLPQAKAVLMNFYEELVPSPCVDDLKSKMQSLFHLGFLSLSLPLPPRPPSDTDATGCLSWLDRQSTRSVAFLSFGTVMIPPPHELVAIAETLEESRIPFLWSLKDNFLGILPKGFLERTCLRGKVVPWAPQIHVLGHDSVGVFVTHCGLNSVSESVLNEVPMICRPLIGDHGISARIIEDVWRIGVRVEGGVFSKNGLVKSLKLVLLEKEGKKMRKNIQVVKKIVVDAAGPKGKAGQDFPTLVDLISSS